MESLLVEIVWPQSLPEDVKIYSEGNRYFIDITSPMLLSRQKVFGELFDLWQENGRLWKENIELCKELGKDS